MLIMHWTLIMQWAAGQTGAVVVETAVSGVVRVTQMGGEVVDGPLERLDGRLTFVP